jgi:hypothetical protein
MNTTTEIQNQLFKVGSAWALIGITSWAEAAAALAAIYSLLLILEWLWKKIARPLLVHFGVVEATAQKAGDDE